MIQANQREPTKTEVIARNRFESWVRSHQPNAQLVWQFEPNGHTTPPDFLLTFNVRDFAVEVAVIMRYVQVDGKPRSDHGLFASLSSFLKDIERECLNLGILRGVYLVGSEEAIQEFPRKRSKLRAELVGFIKNTQFEQTTPPQVLLIEGMKACTVSKLGDKNSYIGLSQSYGGWKPEVAPEICRVLRDEVDDKCRKLANIPKPHILILVDEFPLASPYVWFDCLVNYLPAHGFHTIFVVTEKQDYAILTVEQGWTVLDRNSQYAHFGFLEEQ
jgi:hypothetical protein